MRGDQAGSFRSVPVEHRSAGAQEPSVSRSGSALHEMSIPRLLLAAKSFNRRIQTPFIVVVVVGLPSRVGFNAAFAIRLYH